MNTTELFLVALAVIFTVPYAIWRLGRTEYFAPLVVVQIVAGVILGPGLLGGMFPEVYHAVFTKSVIDVLSGLAWWSVSLFVFFAGLELDLNRLKRNRSDAAITAGLALGSPLAICSAFAFLLLLAMPELKGPRAHDWQFVLAIGMAAAVTALPILVLFMQKLQILRRPLGQRILTYSSLDDVAIWAVLAFILMDWQRLGNQALFLTIYAVAAVNMNRLMRALPDPDRIYVAIIWLVLVALGADWCGLHYMVGAFLAGVAIDRTLFDQEFLDRMRDTVLLLMMPVFFLSTGLRTNWELGGAWVIALALVMFAIQIASKMGGIWLAGRLLKWPPGEAALVGFLLQTKALIEIIFVTVLLDKGIITSTMFTVMLLMAIMSTMITIPAVTPLLRKYPHLVDKT